VVGRNSLHQQSKISGYATTRPAGCCILRFNESDIMIEVALSSSSIPPGSETEISISGYARQSSISGISIQLHQLEEAETFWQRSVDRLETNRTDSTLTAVIAVTDDFLPGTLHEIAQLEMYKGEEIVDVIVGGRDFVRTFIEVREPSEVERTQADLRLHAHDLEARRKVVFDRPLGKLDETQNDEYRVFSFVERCLITRRFEFPGFVVGPLTVSGDAAIAEVQSINAVLAAHGWKTSIVAERWAQQRTRDRPLVGFVFPRVLAASPEEAFQLIRAVRDPVLDLFTLHRGATAIPVVTVMEKRVFGAAMIGGRALEYEGGGYFQETQPYTGNLIGGFISGEVPTTLINHARVVAADPVMALWLSLLREAEAESNPDFAFFRYWNLLETISIERVKSGKPVEGFDGHAIKAGRKQATTTGARGRVYQLLQDKMKSTGMPETAYTVQPGEDLWQATSVWCGFRNATAHYGRFRPDDPDQQKQWWYEVTLSAHNFVEALQPDQKVLGDPYLRNLKQSANDFLHRELNSAAQALPSLFA
jgi:hypothetical protein